MKKRPLRVPDSELDVLRVLWKRESSTAADVRDALSAQRKEAIAHPTVVTLLQRLEKKGYVERTGEQIGKAFVYRAVLEPEQVRRHFVSDFLSRHFGNDPIPLFSSLIEGGDLSLKEIKQLREMLKTQERAQMRSESEDES